MAGLARILARIIGAVVLFAVAARAEESTPNIVLIYGDDVGYGDIGCNGATRAKTPNLDKLASESLRFTDAHSSSATCTPSRFALLTGEYAFRQKGTGVLPGDAALIIHPDRLTLPMMLQKEGYVTGAIGKWHLGLGINKAELDWNTEIKPGPREVGFNYSFIMPATGDRTPCVYVENQRVAGTDPADPIRVSFSMPVGDDPTGKDHPELLKMHPSHGHDQTIVNGISRIGYMSGGNKARWVDENLADTLTKKAEAFLEENKDKKFFLYFATHDIHVPRAPNPRFVGKTDMGPRGDVIVELDYCAGEILKTLERLGLTGRTIVMFSSDNGPVVDDGYKDQAFEKLGDHKPAGPYRGGKYSNFEGGTRVPLMVKWPGRVKPGVSSALVCQVDFLASFAALTGYKLAERDAPDSFNVLPALLGDSTTGRSELVEHAGLLSMREGNWKYIPASNRPKFNAATHTEMGNDPQPQLYNLADDPGEKNNLSAREEMRVKEMSERVGKISSADRSRP